MFAHTWKIYVWHCGSIPKLNYVCKLLTILITSTHCHGLESKSHFLLGHGTIAQIDVNQATTESRPNGLYIQTNLVYLI